MRNFVIWCVVLPAMAGTAFSETKEPPKKLAVDLGKGVKLDMVLIPAGEFKMGSGESAKDIADLLEAEFFKNEHPQHQVRITKPYHGGRSTGVQPP